MVHRHPSERVLHSSLCTAQIRSPRLCLCLFWAGLSGWMTSFQIVLPYDHAAPAVVPSQICFSRMALEPHMTSAPLSAGRCGQQARAALGPQRRGARAAAAAGRAQPGRGRRRGALQGPGAPGAGEAARRARVRVRVRGRVRRRRGGRRGQAAGQRRGRGGSGQARQRRGRRGEVGE